MVNELKTSNNNNANRSLDLSALGETATQSITVDEKPVLAGPTRGEIINVELTINENTLKSNKNDPESKFYPCLLRVRTKFINPDTNEEYVSNDNYSGLRFYPKTDESGEPMVDSAGNPVLDRFWSGDTSFFGKLLKLVQEYDKSVVTYADFFSFMNQTPKECMIATEYANNPSNGTQVTKEVIKKFL